MEASAVAKKGGKKRQKEGETFPAQPCWSVSVATDRGRATVVVGVVFFFFFPRCQSSGTGRMNGRRAERERVPPPTHTHDNQTSLFVFLSFRYLVSVFPSWLELRSVNREPLMEPEAPPDGELAAWTGCRCAPPPCTWACQPGSVLLCRSAAAWEQICHYSAARWS